MMTGWYAERTPDRPARAMIAVTLLALLLVAAVPVALLAAAIAVALAGMSGIRHLRKLLSGGGFRVVRLDGSQYTDVAEPVAEPEGSDYPNLLQLDRSEYTEIR